MVISLVKVVKKERRELIMGKNSLALALLIIKIPHPFSWKCYR